MAVTKKLKEEQNNNGLGERVTEAAEGKGGHRSCLIDHRGADI